MRNRPCASGATKASSARGKASAIRTCNSWVASRLRLAGVKTSAWPPFAQGLLWRYRESAELPTARSG